MSIAISLISSRVVIGLRPGVAAGLRRGVGEGLRRGVVGGLRPGAFGGSGAVEVVGSEGFILTCPSG
ncbi:hypothetical protein [Gordonia otitidis]|uniref:hypothetical protein n=1 Tax=Gordonia otitidis TaxID=249058 RepID=UPI000586AC84|nr:hypothetical protein [Gordonia otitidis]